VDRETEKHYQSLKDMFRTDGWKVLMDELRNNALQINSVEATKDNEELNFRKGQLNILAFVLNMESTVEHYMNEGSNDSV
jgi:hypothetical protein